MQNITCRKFTYYLQTIISAELSCHNFERAGRTIYLFAIDHSVAALKGALLRVAIDALQERAATAERQVVGAPAVRLHVLQDRAQRLVADAVALDDANARRQHLVALRVLRCAEFIA